MPALFYYYYFMELRDPIRIAKQMRAVRMGKASMAAWTLEEIAADIESVSTALSKDIQKLRKWNFTNMEARLRIRSYTKAIDVLGKQFRILSVQ